MITFLITYAHLFLLLYWTSWMEECGGMRDRIQFRSFLWFTSLRLLLIFWDLLEILDHKTLKNFIGNKQVREIMKEMGL